MIGRKRRRLNRLPTLCLRFASLALSSLFLLSGCAPGAHHATIQPQQGEAALIAPAEMLTLADGAAIPVRIWNATTPPKAIILALHGFGDSRDAWEWSAPLMAKAGLTVYAPDQRGFGASPARGDWVGSARMIADAREEAAWLHARFPGLPLYIMGESMGGAVALRLDEEPISTPIAGTILVSPAIWRFDRASRAVLSALDHLAPHWHFDASDSPVHVTPSDNIAAMRRLYFDPLTLHGSSLHALHGLVTLMAEARTHAGEARTPLLVLYGDEDQLVPPAAMRSFWHAAPREMRRDLVRGGHHLLLRDRDGARATADIMAWIADSEDWLPSGGDSAAAAWAATTH